MISCLTAVISAPVSLWLSRGGFFSPLAIPGVGSKPMGEVPNTDCGPDAEPVEMKINC